MPRYFFAVHDKIVSYDEVGQELADLHEVRHAAMRILPPIAADEIPDDGDRRHFVVLVTDEGGRPVYSATMSYFGLWLQPELEPGHLQSPD